MGGYILVTYLQTRDFFFFLIEDNRQELCELSTLKKL